MSRREKTEFILQQVSLCIEKGDWTQAGILSRKIGTKYFTRKPKKSPEQLEKEKNEREEKEKKRSADDPPPEPEDDVTDLKLKYYEQQILLSKHDEKYLEACKHYRQVLDTEAVEENPEQLRAVSRTSDRSSTSTNIVLGASTSHLLCHSCALRQRTI
jgi:26S proteasome regulatory subunit N5